MFVAISRENLDDKISNKSFTPKSYFISLHTMNIEITIPFNVSSVSNYEPLSL